MDFAIVQDETLEKCQYLFTFSTRQSSCVNTRGIPPAVYQVLPLLSYSTGVPPSLAGGVPYRWMGRYPISGQGVSHPWWGVPYPWMGRYPPYLDRGYPILTWLGHPHPDLDLARVPSPRRDLGSVIGIPLQSLGYPPERTWDQWKYYGMEMGYPP